MGKAQSKRSVDITTEVGKDEAAIEEGANKIGKIDDVDQLKPQLNGDANHKDAVEVSANSYSSYIFEYIDIIICEVVVEWDTFLFSIGRCGMRHENKQAHNDCRKWFACKCSRPADVQ